MRFPRLDFAGARHHVMNRGARREPIFLDDNSRSLCLKMYLPPLPPLLPLTLAAIAALASACGPATGTQARAAAVDAQADAAAVDGQGDSADQTGADAIAIETAPARVDAAIDAPVDVAAPPDTVSNGDSHADSAEVDVPPAPIAPPGMVLIGEGTFWMGCNAAKDKDCKAEENPQHKVTLGSYYLDASEVTAAQYKTCVDAGACSEPVVTPMSQFATWEVAGKENHPVGGITWVQAQAYCEWRGAGYGLPTEAQWEMAARGSCEKNGSTADDSSCATAMRKYPWGDSEPDCTMASWSEVTGCGPGITQASPKPVGSMPAGDSPYGVHDMAGNQNEWVADFFGSYGATAQTDPTGPSSGTFRAFRGGYYFSFLKDLRSSSRSAAPPQSKDFQVGVRCAKAYP